MCEESPQNEDIPEEMHRLRRTVKDLLNPEAGPEKGNEYSGDSAVRNTNSSTDTESYALRRQQTTRPPPLQK